MAVFRSCNLIAHKCREVISLSTPSLFFVNYFLETEKIMGRVVKDEKELAQAIKNNVDYIEVEGGIKDFFIRGCPVCFLILKGVVISSHETNRFS